MTAAGRIVTAQATQHASSGTSPIVRTLRAEWTKLITLRSTRIMLGLGIGLSIAATALGCLAMGNAFDEWPADFDPYTFSMVGNAFALIIYSVFGVVTITREYSSGMIQVTLSALPGRGGVLFAKMLLVALITFVLGLATTFGMFLVGQAALGAAGLPGASLADRDALRLVIGLGAVMPFVPVVGVALGVLLRSTAAAITATLGLLWLPLILAEMLPPWWQENVISLLPGTALDSFTISHVIDSPTYLDPWAGVVVALVWLAGFLGAAWLVFARRDV